MHDHHRHEMGHEKFWKLVYTSIQISSQQLNQVKGGINQTSNQHSFPSYLLNITLGERDLIAAARPIKWICFGF